MWTGKEVIELRVQLSMSPFQFAKKLGVSMATVELWETGMFIPPADEAKLNGLNSQVLSYLEQKRRLDKERQRKLIDGQKTEYLIGQGPQGTFVGTKRR